MTKRSLDYPWLFINGEMLRFARTLAESKLRDDKWELAKAVFELTSSRFQSPKSSVRIFRTYIPEPAYKIWKRGGKTGALKQSIVVKSMLLTTGFFRDSDIRLLHTQAPQYATAWRGHYYLKVRVGKTSVYQDSWGREWKVEYGKRLVPGKATDFPVQKVMGEWDRKHQTSCCTLYLRD